MATTPNYAQFVSTAKDQVEKSTSQFLKGFESLNDLTKQNVDAFMKSSSILAKGFELSVKVANEAFQPISAQINATLGKLTKPLAA